MSQDFPQANARLAEVARHWADGEVSHETWRRERRTILREICNRRSDVQIGGGVLPVQRKASVADVTSPDVPVVKAAQAPSTVTAAPIEDIQNDDVLTLALLLILVLAGALLVFYLA